MILIPEADKDSKIFNKEEDKLLFSKYIVWKISQVQDLLIKQWI